jgi:hypothetical protein
MALITHDAQTVTELRLRLRRAGYSPLPALGKAVHLDGWPNKIEVTDFEIRNWEKIWPTCTNTGALTRLMPAFDIDIIHQPAAEAVEALVRERFDERGYILVRTGKPPKRAILFRTGRPFPKIAVKIVPAAGVAQRLEFLCDGQQLVIDGIHPDTGKPYCWHGGEPGQIKLEDLPYITETEAKDLVADVVKMLGEEYGYEREHEPPKARTKARKEGKADWSGFLSNIIEHDNLVKLAMSLLTSGMNEGAVVNFLRDAVERIEGADPAQKKRRLNEIPGIVESGREKIDESLAAAKAPPAVAPRGLAEVIAVFDKWLILADHTPIYAVLGTIAANLLPGDPVWLGLIAPPSSAKTEILNSLSLLPYIEPTATLTPAALLSGTPRRQRGKGAKGGLLPKIGEFGILVLKDFGSILSMRPEAKAEILAALREVYDGSWTRQLGTDGGKTLRWDGKIGLLFGATEAYDDHHSVIGSLGDRFLLCRLNPQSDGLLKKALDHTGASTKLMREELATAVAGLFVNRLPDPPAVSDAEIEELDEVVTLAVRLRAHVNRDRYSREIESIHGAEGPGRLGLCLERLLAGLTVIGVDRSRAFRIIKNIALASTPPIRLAAFHLLDENLATTRDIARQLRLPTITAKRALEDLTAHGLAIRERPTADDGTEQKGGADRWRLDPSWQGLQG